MDKNTSLQWKILTKTTNVKRSMECRDVVVRKDIFDRISIVRNHVEQDNIDFSLSIPSIVVVFLARNHSQFEQLIIPFESSLVLDDVFD